MKGKSTYMHGYNNNNSRTHYDIDDDGVFIFFMYSRRRINVHLLTDFDRVRA